MRTLFVCAIIYSAMGTTLSAQSPSVILERAASTYRAATTIHVRFEQALTNPLLGTTLTSRGELFRKKPNLLAINFSDPARDRVVADGKSLWIYLPSSAPGQVIKTSASDAQGTLIDPLGQVLASAASRYTITSAGTAMLSGHPTHAVTLAPKAGMPSLFTSATVWVDDTDATVRQIETTEPSGVVRKVFITKFTPNATIPADAFVFTPPANVRVVTGGANPS